MKIAFLIWDYSPARGGQERYLSRLAGALARLGHEIHVFATRRGEGAGDGVRFHRVAAGGIGPATRTLSYIRRARRALAAERFDITSGLTRHYPLDVFRMGGGLHRIWLQKRGPAERLLARTRPLTWLALGLERRIFDPRNCRRVIANSRLCRDQLLRLYPYPAERVSVVYNGVDHDLFRPGLGEAHRAGLLRRLGLPETAPAALFASNNLGRKGLGTVCRALARMGDAAPSLLVAGGGDARPYEALCRRLGVAARVRFLGRLADMRPAYGAADYLVLPTRYDPFANVCLEAMACGLPVITSRDNGAAEILDEGADGVTLDAGDDAALAAAMRALGDRAARERMGAAARAKSLAYTVERNAGETLAVYRLVLEERHARAV
ncbi:MAG: glycosyltransferase family 4 protein [bacterium]|nr:glycosyltransferase family 4 protein [bacterium]